MATWKKMSQADLSPRANFRATTSARRRAGYTVLLIPEESGNPIRMGFPRWSIVVGLCAVFCVLGGFSAMIIDYMKVQNIVHDYERLRAENHSIRSEAAAIISRLENVQSSLNKVDSISNQIREISKPEGTSKAIKGKPGGANRLENRKGERLVPRRGALVFPAKRLPLQQMGIGPVPREDYILAKAMGKKTLALDPSVNVDKLEFREIFQQLIAIGSQSESKSRELERLLREVRDYQVRISSTPTMAPTQGYVSSLFGTREGPFSGIEQMHTGIDIAAPTGTPVYASAAGTVVSVRMVSDYGKVVDIDHGNGIRTRYAHLSAFETKPGARVNKGDLVARVGDTGRSTGPHLHYEVEVNGHRVNPIHYIHDW